MQRQRKVNPMAEGRRNYDLRQAPDDPTRRERMRRFHILLHSRGVTVGDLAKAIGSHRSHVCQVLNGYSGVGGRTRLKLAGYLTDAEREALGWGDMFGRATCSMWNNPRQKRRSLLVSLPKESRGEIRTLSVPVTVEQYVAVFEWSGTEAMAAWVRRMVGLGLRSVDPAMEEKWMAAGQPQWMRDGGKAEAA